MKYEKMLKRVLAEDLGPAGAPQQQPPDDGAVWKERNPGISDNPDIAPHFETEGLPREEIEKYSEIIAKWGEGIKNAIDQLAQMLRFATEEKLKDAPGSDQFSDLVKQAPGLKRDLSAFKSQVEDLSQTVKLSIRDASKERKSKLDDLRA